MTIRDGESSIEIVMTERVPDNLPTPNDLRLHVAVTSQGFSGAASVWINADSFHAFIRQLRDLDAKRRGAAELEALSPGEFMLRIGSVDRRGHMALSGRLAKQLHIYESGPFAHVVEFGFEFDCTLLPSIVSDFEKLSGVPKI